eukprot:6217736-Prymnesium_polylepis.1
MAEHQLCPLLRPIPELPPLPLSLEPQWRQCLRRGGAGEPAAPMAASAAAPANEQRSCRREGWRCGLSR